MAKPFTFNSVINPLALRTGLIDLRAHRVPLPAVVCPEALLRGCDHRAWFEKFAGYGLRHLIVPLNSLDEDTCLFARRHPKWAIDSIESSANLQKIDALPVEASSSNLQPALPPPEPKPKKRKTTITSNVLFDLEHRDEGFFARLKFLLEAADAAGVLVGISIFDVSATQGGGPFRRQANLQSIAWEELLAKPDAPEWETFERLLKTACGWIAGDVRTRKGVWVSPFRGEPAAAAREKLNALNERLTRYVASTLFRPGDEQSRTKNGPWFVATPGLSVESSLEIHRAPFDLRCGVSPELDAAAEIDRYLTQPHVPAAAPPNDASIDSFEADPRRPVLFLFDESGAAVRGAARMGAELAWRSLMRGFSPCISAGLSNQGGMRRCHWMSQIAIFAKQWVGKGYLRACPELLAALPADSIHRGPVHAATDGAGRYFVYFEKGWLQTAAAEEPPPPPVRTKGRASKKTAVAKIAPRPAPKGPPAAGIRVALLPGAYRFFWFDPQRGKGLDFGDGIAGGTSCVIPGFNTDRDAVLVIEHEELPDPLSVW